MWPISEFMNESRLRTCGSASLARPNNFHPEYFRLNGRRTGCLSRNPFKNTSTCRRFRPRCERFFYQVMYGQKWKTQTRFSRQCAEKHPVPTTRRANNTVYNRFYFWSLTGRKHRQAYSLCSCTIVGRSCRTRSRTWRRATEWSTRTPWGSRIRWTAIVTRGWTPWWIGSAKRAEKRFQYHFKKVAITIHVPNTFRDRCRPDSPRFIAPAKRRRPDDQLHTIGIDWNSTGPWSEYLN